MPFRNVASIVRGLLHRPAFTLTAVLSLGIGIGAATTVFSVVNALFLKALPYREPERLVTLWPGKFLANREVAGLRERSRSYSEIGAFSPGWLMSLTGVETPLQLNAARVSGNFFDLLGVRAAIGRSFGLEAEITGQDQVAVLGHELFESTFASDPSVIGRSVRLDGVGFTVIGVMPRDFRTFDAGTDLWTPLTMDQSAMTWAGATAFAYGRLKPGVTAAQASTELALLAPQLQRDLNLGQDWAQGTRVLGLQENLVGSLRPTVLVLFAAAGFLLLISAANVANLLLVRTTERRHELSVRASLGASPRQITRLLLAESLCLGVAGGTLGLVLSAAGVGLLHRILPPDLPRLAEISVDLRVLAGAIALTLLTTVLFGLGPALQGRGATLARGLAAGRTTTARGQRTRGVVVAAEVALAVTLSIGATLMGRTLVALHRVDPGLRSDHLLTMVLQPSARSSAEEYRAYWSDVLGRLRALPEVTGAATILHLPTSGRSWKADILIADRPLPPGTAAPRAAWQVVSPEYFQTAGVPILRGRTFDQTDIAGGPRVIAVNDAFARRLFPGEDPIGRRITAGNATQGQSAEIVAVVGGVRHDSLNLPPHPEVYVPFSQRLVIATSLVLRTTGDPLALAGAIRETIWSVDRNVPIHDVRTMDDRYADSLVRWRMVLILLGLFAGIGLLLSAVGIYGVVAYGVRQRMRELGIRMALGATPRRIRWLVLRHGIRYAAIGLTAGLGLTYGLVGLVRGLLFGVPPTDPVSFSLVPVALLLVALAASWLPANRAAGGDVTVVLRE